MQAFFEKWYKANKIGRENLYNMRCYSHQLTDGCTLSDARGKRVTQKERASVVRSFYVEF